MCPKKFRVFNKNLGRFVNYDEWFISLDGRLMFYSIGDGIPLSSDKADRLIECKAENYIIQQFTGLLDINDKELYEGDLIKNGKYIILISYDAPSFIFTYKYQDGRWVERYWADIICPKLIGNICENPELIK